MNNPRITVVVPVYNIKEYIEKTVESIIKQTYYELEIVLVDDGSTDGSSDILDRLAKIDNRIIVIHKDNGGVSSARLTGVRFAHGEWIGFVDGDDYIEPSMYEILINNALKYEVDISHCGYQMVFPSRVDYYYNTKKTIIQDNKQGLIDLLEGSFIEPALWNKIFKKNLFDRIFDDSFDLSIKLNEDLLMNYYLFSASRVSVFEDCCPYHYIVRQGSAANSTITENDLTDPIKVRKIIRDDCKSDRDLRILMDNSVLNSLIALATMELIRDKKLKKPYRKAARQEIRKKLISIVMDSYTKKNKVSGIWVAIWPFSYTCAHKLYSKIKGTDRKYEYS